MVAAALRFVFPEIVCGNELREVLGVCWREDLVCDSPWRRLDGCAEGSVEDTVSGGEGRLVRRRLYRLCKGGAGVGRENRGSRSCLVASGVGFGRGHRLRVDEARDEANFARRSVGRADAG
uniref:Uncharacterized protein n=1 Tax=Oryza punctata TaxID=4537 RepID=A0A0E0LU40_ORYPU